MATCLPDSQENFTKSRKHKEKQLSIEVKTPRMNELSPESTSGKNLAPRRLEQKVQSNKNPVDGHSQKMSFHEVLKEVADKAEGSSVIRQDVVDKFKVSLANGTYEVKAQELADKMIQKIRENKTREII